MSTLVVSWKLDAEMNDSVESDALVIPRSSGSPVAGFPPVSVTRAFSASKCPFSTCSSMRKVVSPTSLTRTRRSICRTIVSMCLSLIFTPWSR